MEDATNTIKKICGRYSLTYHSSTIFNKKAKVSNKKFPKTKEKKKNNIWIVFYPDMKRNCWLFKSIGGNKFVAACKKVVAFYIPAGYEYLIEAATDAFFMVITERE